MAGTLHSPQIEEKPTPIVDEGKIIHELGIHNGPKRKLNTAANQTQGRPQSQNENQCARLTAGKNDSAASNSRGGMAATQIVGEKKQPSRPTNGA